MEMAAREPEEKTELFYLKKPFIIMSFVRGMSKHYILIKLAQLQVANLSTPVRTLTTGHLFFIISNVKLSLAYLLGKSRYFLFDKISFSL